MDAFITLFVGLIAAAAAWIFKDIESKKLRAQRDILDLELQKAAKKQKVREAAIKSTTARIAYEKAKENFLKKYNSTHIDEYNKLTASISTAADDDK